MGEHCNVKINRIKCLERKQAYNPELCKFSKKKQQLFKSIFASFRGFVEYIINASFQFYVFLYTSFRNKQ